MRKLYLALAAAGALLLLALIALSTCSTPAPSPPAPVKVSNSRPLPTPAATAIASSSAAATASQAVRVTIRRPVEPHAPQTRAKNLRNGTETQAGSGGPHAQDFEEIVIEVTQTATAAASSEASASAQPVSDPYKFDHARLGLIALTAPGILAIDYQLTRIDVPPWLFGLPLELGLDVATNLEAGALGVTAGGKAFAGGYAWSRWDLGAQGLAAGVGLRF
ncbi:hypothetical protein D3C86_1286410 [compost metagenome]